VRGQGVDVDRARKLKLSSRWQDIDDRLRGAGGLFFAQRDGFFEHSAGRRVGADIGARSRAERLETFLAIGLR